MVNKKKIEKDKRYLIIGILYLICSFLWVIGGACKLMVEESYIIDIALGLVWLALSFVYFTRFRKGSK